MQRSRLIAMFGLVPLSLALAGCASTRSEVRQAERPVAPAPEVALAGFWRVEETTPTSFGQRTCYFELQSELSSGTAVTNMRGVKVTDRCNQEMQVIAGWRPEGDGTGSEILLLDVAGEPVGQFERLGGTLYQGAFLLSTGAKISAQMRAF